MWIVCALVGVVMLLISKTLGPSRSEQNAVRGLGTVREQFRDDDGKFRYYVQFYDQNGILHDGKSKRYCMQDRRLSAGETVNIRYYFSPKGKAFVIIDEEGMEYDSDAFVPTQRFMRTASVILLVLAVVLLVVQLAV